jgi:hypothetical protein
LSIDDSLTHTNSQPCEDERDQRHDILDATSPMQHDHANRYLSSARSQLQVVFDSHAGVGIRVKQKAYRIR